MPWLSTCMCWFNAPWSSTSFLHCTLNKEFRFVLTQFKTIVMERIRKSLHYILVVYTSTIWTQLHWLSALAFGCMTGGPKMSLAHLSYSQRQVQLRHRSSVHEGEDNQTSRCCTSWRDTSKHCTRYISIICIYRCINYNACMHAVTLLLILACVDLMHLEVV